MRHLLLVQWHRFLISRIISKMCLEMAFIASWFTSDASRKFFPSAAWIPLLLVTDKLLHLLATFITLGMAFCWLPGASGCQYVGHPKDIAFTVVLLWSSRRPHPMGMLGFELGPFHLGIIVICRGSAPGVWLSPLGKIVSGWSSSASSDFLAS